MLLAIPGYSLIADGSNYWRSKIRRCQCSSPQGLACPGSSADLTNYLVNIEKLICVTDVVMPRFICWNLPTLRWWSLPVLEQLPVRRGSGVACALQIQGRQSEFKTSWSGPNVGGGHWRLFWGACWSAQAAWSSRIIVDKLIQTGQCCLGDLKWVERKMPSKRDGGSGEYEVEKWECCIYNGWRNEKKLCIQIATHMIQIVKSCFTHLQNVIQTLKSP